MNWFTDVFKRFEFTTIGPCGEHRDKILVNLQVRDSSGDDSSFESSSDDSSSDQWNYSLTSWIFS